MFLSLQLHEQLLHSKKRWTHQFKHQFTSWSHDYWCPSCKLLIVFFEKSLSVVIIVVIIFFVFIIKCHCQMHLEVLASGFKPASQPQIPVKQRNSEGNVGMETSKKCSETGESTNMKLQEHQMSHCVTRWSFAKSEIMGEMAPNWWCPTVPPHPQFL